MRKFNYTFKTKSQINDFDTKDFLCKIDGNVPEKGIPLVHSKEVALEPLKRRMSRSKVFSRDESRQNTSSSRINKKTGRTLDRSIHLYRLWFHFLKLALELEQMKVSLVVKREAFIKDFTSATSIVPKDVRDRSAKEYAERTKDMRQTDHSGGTHDAVLRCKVIQRVKVKRSAYKGWDLPRVLTEDWNTWWYGHEGWGFTWDKSEKNPKRVFIKHPDLEDTARRGHSHLFEGYVPTFLDSKKEWIDDDNFLYIRIDKTTQVKDVTTFMSEEVGKRMKDKGTNRYRVGGKQPRPNVFQNNYNALVLSLKGWSNKEICEDNKIYLRRTDEAELSSRSSGDRLTVSIGKKTGTPLYSKLVSTQRNMGIHHLLEVCDGRFGISPPTK